MKRFLTLALASIIALGFTALNAADDKKDTKAAKPYPLKTCVVSDEDLGSDGEPYVFVHEGQEFKLCCKPCKPDFDKDPKKYHKKVADALAKQKK